MSQTLPLSPARRDELRALLEARARELEREVAAGLHAGEAPGIANRAAETDEAVAELEASLDIASVARDTGELEEVRAALARIDDPDFGRCPDCAQPIGWARLRARPHATRCLACAEALERSRMPRDPRAL
jgi:DnaK suppressor protein